ncbi:Asp-tRNA(Asn)/Glu-tRNA(Gln) amidotransferase subunit GatA [Limisalsivibrio acetivorans]|uniref:Asp-tRNA(Asn)/Glu-tRNA(Gln) amidotransferase subunit GatA n=1 Tax=Limisalsivibrio acetivorans TaxID=1304888 RepID=UPI0003B4116A|nr:Asp-tRNA(Asn)/Glu-tRNA(Gln) amidotransferase subunit GatA [Limisalsivibrio acetivorans]
MNIIQMNLNELADALKDIKLTAEEIVGAYLDRIKRYDEDVKAYIHINENALEEAKEWDRKRQAGEDVPRFAGIPVALKDLIVTDNMPTTCSSRILEGFNAPYSANVAELLRKSGMVFLGKLSMDEFAMGSSNETSYYKQTRNPWDLERVPGGSSGGSAAAVAARLAPVTLGSDTGGSIRQPASLCGVIGMKPTYGRVSRFGLVAFASSLDQIGPFSWNVSDAAEVLSIIGQHDEKDSTSAPVEGEDYASLMQGDVKGMKIGIPKEFFAEGLNEEVKQRVEEAIRKLEDLGCETVEISMPHNDYAVSVYYIIATAEASSNLARYDGVKYGFRKEADNLKDMYFSTRSEGFGEEVKRRIMLGTYVLSAGYYDAYYLKAQKVRTLIKKDYESAFEKVDAIICPTSPTTAFKFGEKSDDPLEMYLSDIYTISLNLYGGCGLSLPCGFDSKGLPVGFQILGGHFEEGKVLRLAKAYEDAVGGFGQIPGTFEG